MPNEAPSLSIRTELHRLAEFLDGQVPTLTLYLDARGQDQHQREAIRTFVRRGLSETRRTWRGPAPGGASLEADLARVERDVEELTARGAGGGAPGIALFACAAKDLFLDLRCPVALRHQF